MFYSRLKLSLSIGIISLVIGLIIANLVPVLPFGRNMNTVLAASCPYPVATRRPAGTTTIASNPSKFTMLESGDILAGTVITSGTNRYLAIGGNFPGVVTPDGRSHPAANLAVLNEATGAVVYAAKSANSYVRALFYDNGVLYVGGDFTSLNGIARHYIAAINTTTWKVTSWAPYSAGAVRAIAASTSGRFVGVYYGGDSNRLYDVSPVTGKLIWTDTVGGGAIKALLLSPDTSGLFVGGLFEQVSTLTQHGLMEVYPATTGKPYTPFRPILRTDNPPNSDTGEENLSLAWDTSYRSPIHLIMGDGGATVNAIRSISPSNGVGYWGDHTEGDAQGVAVVGNTYVAGYHRNHDNISPYCPYPYFSAQFSQANGTILTYWNSELSGDGSNADHGNNGVQAITADPVTKKLFLLGAFKTHGATCPTWDTCTGGTPLRGIALFSYN